MFKNLFNFFQKNNSVVDSKVTSSEGKLFNNDQKILAAAQLVKCKHSFHMVKSSLQSVKTSGTPFVFILTLVNFLLYTIYSAFLAGFVFAIFLVPVFHWSSVVVREASYMGVYTLAVQKNLRTGMMLFIVSEVIFFFSLFWACIHFNFFGFGQTKKNSTACATAAFIWVLLALAVYFIVVKVDGNFRRGRSSSNSETSLSISNELTSDFIPLEKSTVTVLFKINLRTSGVESFCLFGVTTALGSRIGLFFYSGTSPISTPLFGTIVNHFKISESAGSFTKGMKTVELRNKVLLGRETTDLSHFTFLRDRNVFIATLFKKINKVVESSTGAIKNVAKAKDAALGGNTGPAAAGPSAPLPVGPSGLAAYYPAAEFVLVVAGTFVVTYGAIWTFQHVIVADNQTLQMFATRAAQGLAGVLEVYFEINPQANGANDNLKNRYFGDSAVEGGKWDETGLRPSVSPLNDYYGQQTGGGQGRSIHECKRDGWHASESEHKAYCLHYNRGDQPSFSSSDSSTSSSSSSSTGSSSSSSTSFSSRDSETPAASRSTPRYNHLFPEDESSDDGSEEQKSSNERKDNSENDAKNMAIKIFLARLLWAIAVSVVKNWNKNG